MSFTKLDEKWTKPRVAVLDDQPNEIQPLIRHLEAFGYVVTLFTKASTFLEEVRTKVFPIQMIDVSLSRISNDSDGFRVARECAKLHPEALRICISGKLLEIPIKEIVVALNPRPDAERALALPVALGVRDIWAIFDKEDDGKDLRVIIENYRATVGACDATEIFVDESLRKDFEEGFQSIPWEQLGVVVEAQLQVVEIVRQLARRPGMPAIRKILLEKLGKGRSKTVVALMRIEFDGRVDVRPIPATVKERQSIIKIGRFGSIHREIANYSEVLPQIFPAAFYPYIEASGVSRTLAGVAYSCLQDERRKIAPTLLDALCGGLVDLAYAEAVTGVKRAFEFKRNQAVSLASATREGTRLLKAYTQRFPVLEDVTKSSLHSLQEPITLSDTLRESNEILLEHELLYGEGPVDGARYLKIGSRRIPAGNSIAQFTHSHARWEDFWVGPGHGDLHLDNILLIQQGDAWTNFYIDFADAGQHHVMLDFVIMENALRFQSLRFLEGLYTEQYEGPLLRALAGLESNLLQVPSEPTAFLPPELQAWVSRTQDIASVIRNEAWRYVETELRPRFQEAFGLESPRVEEEVLAEQHRFYCGIGLAALAAMHLRQPPSVARLHQAWFALVGQTYMNQFNEWKNSR